MLVFPRWIGGNPQRPGQLLLADSTEFVGVIDAATGSQEWERAEGLQRRSLTTSGVATEFDNGLTITVTDDGTVRTLDPTSGSLIGEVLPVLTGRPADMDLAQGGRAAAVATTTGVSVIAIDGSGLLNDAFPVTERPDELTVAAGGLVAAATSFSTEAVTVFDRTDDGFEHRQLSSDRQPGLIGLYRHQVEDPEVGVEWALGDDVVVRYRMIDAQTLEPMSNWLEDAGDLAVDKENGLQYVRHELENRFRPNGEHLFRVYAWPNGEEVASPIEAPTGEVGAYPKIVLDGGRLVVGTNPFAETLWAFDTELDQLVDPPFTIDAGVHACLKSLADGVGVAIDQDALDHLDDLVGPTFGGADCGEVGFGFFHRWCHQRHLQLGHLDL